MSWPGNNGVSGDVGGQARALGFSIQRAQAQHAKGQAAHNHFWFNLRFTTEKCTCLPYDPYLENTLLYLETTRKASKA